MHSSKTNNSSKYYNISDFVYEIIIRSHCYREHLITMHVDVWFYVILPAVFNQLIHTSLTWRKGKREYYFNNYVLNIFVNRNPHIENIKTFNIW